MSELTFRQQIARTLIISAFVTLASAFFTSPDAYPPVDFYQSWAATVSDGLMTCDNVYGRDDRAAMAKEFGRVSEMSSISELQSDIAGKTKSLAPIGSPLDLALMKHLFIGDFERDYLFFRTLSVFSFLFGVSLIYLSLRPGAGLISCIAVPLLAALYPPFWLDLFAGGLNSLQMLFIGAGVALFVHLDESWRYSVAGAALTFAAMVKPTAVYAVPLLVVLFAFGRGGRAAAMSLVGVLFAVAFSWIVVHLVTANRPAWIDYRQALVDVYQPQLSGSLLWRFKSVDFWVAVAA
ncbi:MAG: DUF2029 domain-containing protein, partial [Elusimicrobia bacterium]|nr:DUF2029 domain-containing protein [Elusimicrobiota bacterium]